MDVEAQVGSQQSHGSDPQVPQHAVVFKAFDDKAIRRGFIQKVYGILCAQLLLTAGISASMIFIKDLNEFFREHAYLYFVFAIAALVVQLILVCVPGLLRSFPTNLILLLVFTIFEGLVVGMIVIHHDVKTVLLAVILTAIAVLVLSGVACFAPFDITSWGHVLCVLLLLHVVLGAGTYLIIAIFNLYQYFRTLHLIICFLGLFLMMLYLVYDTQLIVGGRRHQLSPEDYIGGALALYVDIIMIFIYLLSILNDRN